MGFCSVCLLSHSDLGLSISPNMTSLCRSVPLSAPVFLRSSSLVEVHPVRILSSMATKRLAVSAPDTGPLACLPRLATAPTSILNYYVPLLPATGVNTCDCLDSTSCFPLPSKHLHATATLRHRSRPGYRRRPFPGPSASILRPLQAIPQTAVSDSSEPSTPWSVPCLAASRGLTLQ